MGGLIECQMRSVRDDDIRAIDIHATGSGFIAAGLDREQDALRAAGGDVPRAGLGAVHEVDRYGDDLAFHLLQARERSEA